MIADMWSTTADHGELPRTTELSELVHALLRRFLRADEAGENRQVAAFNPYLQVREPAAWSDTYDE